MEFKAIKFMEDAEGRRYCVYMDSAGKPTIGIGHLLTKQELNTGIIRIAASNVRYHNGLNDEQTDALLRQDLSIAHEAIHDTVTVDLTQNQHDSLVSFVFNIGVRAWETSTALRVLNLGQYGNVPAAMRLFNKETRGGKKIVSKGLINRREVEIRLWKGEISNE